MTLRDDEKDDAVDAKETLHYGDGGQVYMTEFVGRLQTRLVEARKETADAHAYLEEIARELAPLRDFLNEPDCAASVTLHDSGDGGRAIRTLKIDRKKVLDLIPVRILSEEEIRATIKKGQEAAEELKRRGTFGAGAASTTRFRR